MSGHHLELTVDNSDDAIYMRCSCEQYLSMGHSPTPAEVAFVAAAHLEGQEMAAPRQSISVILKPDGRCQVSLGEEGTLERLWISDCSVESALTQVKAWLEAKLDATEMGKYQP